MAVYSIKELALLSGIKAHTIRIWEKRYNIFSPNRTDTNIRRYSDADLKLALNISLLQTMGYKISRVARMSEKEIQSTVQNGNQFVKPPSVPESLFVAAMNLDNFEFSKKLDDAIAEKGMEWTFENMIVPFQRRMGLLWQANTITPAQEHFASNIIRDKLIYHSEKLPKAALKAPTILFFLPEGDLHEIGILYFAHIAKQQGFNSVYFGQSLPLSDIIAAIKHQKVDAVFVSVIKSLPDGEMIIFFENLLNSFPKSKIMATGIQVEQNQKEVPKHVIKISSAKDFHTATKSISKKNY